MSNLAWSLCEGVVDSENEFTNIACAEVGDGVRVAYVVNDQVHVVDIAGVFETCPLITTGYGYDEAQDELQPGCVAIPIISLGVAYLMTIEPDNLTLGSLGQLSLPEHLSVAGSEEFDPDDCDDEIKDILQII